jgi:hypothetical protein
MRYNSVSFVLDGYQQQQQNETKNNNESLIGLNYSNIQVVHSIYLTFFLHASSEALLQSTVSALVSLVLVDNAVLLESARVHVILSNASPKESLATVATIRTVMFT